MQVRREVLGDAHVDRAVERTTDVHGGLPGAHHPLCLGRDLGAAGPRPADAQLITLTALVALGREDELAMHVRAALRNGLTPDEIKEVLLHSAIYCGVPAANGAFAIAQRTLAELGGRRRHRRGGTRMSETTGDGGAGTADRRHVDAGRPPGTSFETVDPITGETATTAAAAGPDDARAAADAAGEAFGEWSRSTPGQRRELLDRAATLLSERGRADRGHGDARRRGRPSAGGCSTCSSPPGCCARRPLLTTQVHRRDHPPTLTAPLRHGRAQARRRCPRHRPLERARDPRRPRHRLRRWPAATRSSSRRPRSAPLTHALIGEVLPRSGPARRASST